MSALLPPSLCFEIDSLRVDLRGMVQVSLTNPDFLESEHQERGFANLVLQNVLLRTCFIRTPSFITKKEKDENYVRDFLFTTLLPTTIVEDIG